MVRDRLAAAHGLAPSASNRRDPHLRRPHPGPAAGGGRRQGPVHQGDRGSAGSPARSISPCIRRRTCRRSAAGPGAVRFPAARGCARRLHQPQGEVAGGSAGRRGGRHRLAAPAGDGQAVAAGSRGCAAARQCRDAAAQARRRARPTRRLLALAGLKRLGLAASPSPCSTSTSSCPRSARARSRSRRAPTMRRRAALLAAIDDADTATARLPPSAPFLRCSTAPAARRSPATPRWRAIACMFRGLILRPDGSEAFETVAHRQRAQAADARCGCRPRAQGQGGGKFFRRGLLTGAHPRHASGWRAHGRGVARARS